MTDVEKLIEELAELDAKATKGPWWWDDTGLRCGSRMYGAEHIIYPANTVNPEHLDPPLGPNETGPRYWHAVTGCCGHSTEGDPACHNPMLIQFIGTHRTTILSALRRLALAEKVVDEIRRTKGMTNHPMALKYIRDALSAYDAAKEAQ